MMIDPMPALKADIDQGLTDVDEGRVKTFDADRIIERGKKLRDTRSSQERYSGVDEMVTATRGGRK